MSTIYITIKNILAMNIDKVIFDVDGTLVYKREGGSIALTLLGKAIVKLGLAIRVLSTTGYWDATVLKKLGFNIKEFRVPEYGSTLSIDDDGNQCKVIEPDETLVDDYYNVKGGSLIRYEEDENVCKQDW